LLQLEQTRMGLAELVATEPHLPRHWLADWSATGEGG
jgi:hypothetical protein